MDKYELLAGAIDEGIVSEGGVPEPVARELQAKGLWMPGDLIMKGIRGKVRDWLAERRLVLDAEKLLKDIEKEIGGKAKEGGSEGGYRFDHGKVTYFCNEKPGDSATFLYRDNNSGGFWNVANCGLWPLAGILAKKHAAEQISLKHLATGFPALLIHDSVGGGWWFYDLVDLKWPR